MIDVVYPLANLSKSGDDWELRYSLRSLAIQNWVRNIYLIGHCPDWARNIIHAPCKDPYRSCKDANIINKIMLACSLPDISDNFIVNSDDQYILKSIEIDNMAPVLENPNRLSEYKRIAQANSWPRRLIDALKYCKGNGFPEWIFQSHIPYPVNKKTYPEAMAQIPWGHGNGYVTHIYFNLTLTNQPHNEPVGRTVRLKSKTIDAVLRSQVRSAIFLNHNDSGLQPSIKKFLEEHFPVPSRWER